MPVLEARIGERAAEGYAPVTLGAQRGRVQSRYYYAGGESRAVLYVGGTGGGFDTPADGLYPKLAADLLREGISGLRVRFRRPGMLAESVADLMTGLAFLEGRGVLQAGLVGHSFGGAVVIQAGARSEIVRTVVTLATQSHGAGEAAALAGKPLLLIHGSSDEVLTASSSRSVYRLAPGPRKLVVLEGAGHVLNEKAGEVYDMVRRWLVKYLW